MQIAPRPAAALVAVVAALALVLGAFPADARPAELDSARKSKIAKLTFPARTLVAGQEAEVTGKLKVAKKSKRKVLLQMRLAYSGWRTVDTDKTSKKGKFELRVPTSYYHRKLKIRVFVPRTRRAAAITSKSRGVQVDPPFVPGGSPSSWIRKEPGRVIRYDPCRPVNYRINPQGLADPDSAIADVQASVAQIAAATGLRYHYKGLTSKIFAARPGAGAKKWPKNTNLIVTFGSNDQMGPQTPLTNAAGTAPGAAGWGGQQKLVYARGKEGGRILRTVRSGVVISNEYVMTPGFGRDGAYDGLPPHRGEIIMHELAHAAGLGHTPAKDNDEEQIMDVLNTVVYMPLTYGAGDLTGLNKVGISSGCMRNLRGRVTTTTVTPPPPSS